MSYEHDCASACAHSALIVGASPQRLWAGVLPLPPTGTDDPQPHQPQTTDADQREAQPVAERLSYLGLYDVGRYVGNAIATNRPA